MMVLNGYAPGNLSATTRFLVLLAFLVIVAFAGGASRYDVQSLVFLRPVAALALGFAGWFVQRHQLREFRAPLWFLVATVVAIGVQLIPLPPSVWSTLPGRALLVEVGQAAGVGELWRPVSMVPFATKNALYSMLIPIAALMLIALQPPEARARLLPVVIVIGLVSGVLGLMQAIGPADSPLYLYRVVNEGGAVGLFANRNHQAVFLACLFPALATYAALPARNDAGSRIRFWLCVGAAVPLIPLIIVTGSRLGLLLGVIGLVLAPILFALATPRRTRAAGKRRFGWGHLAGILIVVALIALTLLKSRGLAVDRLVATDLDADVRLITWKTTLEIVRTYFPVGSGYGSFAEIYQIFETDAALKPTYANHAHNDWLEVVMSGGLVGAVLLVAAVIGWAWRVRDVMRAPAGPATAHARLGAALLLMIAIASFTDYPLRTPLFATIAVIAVSWLCAARHKTGPISDEAKPDEGSAAPRNARKI